MADSIKNTIFPFENENLMPIYIPLDSAYFIKQEQNSMVATEAIKKIEETLKNEWYGNFVSSLAILVTFIIFIFQYRYDVKDRRRNTNENWYMNVIIQPNLCEINEYYEKLITLLQSKIKQLKTKQKNQTLEKARAVKDLKYLSKDFVDYFVTILQSYDTSLAGRVENILNNLQDKMSEWVDEYDNVQIDNCKRDIFENKADLVNELYSCITKSKPWYKVLWSKLIKR